MSNRKKEPRIYDITIIGAGIVGLASAYVLSRETDASILVIEAENDLAQHQTGHNSGVIHSGLYYKPGSYKARNCVEGREAMYIFCENNNVEHERCGKIVVATSKKEMNQLLKLQKRGEENGLQGMKLLNSDEMREYEPHVAGKGALYVPQTGIVNYTNVCKALAWHIRNKEHEIRYNTRFLKYHRANPGMVLETSSGPVHTKHLINCAGLQSDRVARLCKVRPGVRIVPFRGEYYVLKKEKQHLVRNLIYPVPDPSFPFLGVHFTRMIDGGVEAGPNAVLAFKREGYDKSSFSIRDTLDTFRFPGFWSLALRYGVTGLGEFYRSLSKSAFVEALQKLVPEVSEEDVEPGGAGVRAQALKANGQLVDDFFIRESENMIHVLNAPSPAATASLSIGRRIANLAKENFRI